MVNSKTEVGSEGDTLSKVGLKLVLSITLLIFLVEGVLLFFSLDRKGVELNKLRLAEKRVYSKNFLFTDEYIAKETEKYQNNVVLLTILISLFVSISFFYIYQHLVGRYIEILTTLNKETSGHGNSFFSLKKNKIVPKNEIGDLIQSRENMLNMLNKKIGENKKLTRILVHDLNNSLAVILLSIGYLEKKSDGLSDVVKGVLSKIKSAATSQKSLIDKVRTIDALQSHKSQAHLEKVLLNDIVGESLIMFEDRLKSKKLTLDYINRDQEDFEIFVDKVLFFNNVFNNLLSNSIKFSIEGKKIIVKSETKESGEQVISFTDSGIGIPDDLAEKIFDSNAKTSRPGTNGEEGTGFGMTLVKETLVSIGGRIEFESKTQERFPEDHGTTFVITLPKAS